MIQRANNLQKPRAILFDLDDTLITDDGVTEKIWFSVTTQFAAEAGLAQQKLYNAIRKSADVYWADPEAHRKGRINLAAARREVVAGAFRELGLDNRSLSDKIGDSFTAQKEAAIQLFEGTLETLRYLKENRYKLALLTNGGSEMQRRKIKRFGLETFFDCYFIEGEFGIGKPDERVFKAALESLNVYPSETWMVGDDLGRDIAGAQKTGIYGVWVDWRGAGINSSEIQPDLIIRSVAELVAKLN